MRKIDSIIEDIKDVNVRGNAWIYDDDGNIKDNIICGNVIDLLEELKPYEVYTYDVDERINYILENSDNRWNTYNWNANIDHHIDVAEMEINGYTYMAIMVHRYGDIRGNYTDRFLVSFDNEYDFFALESMNQGKEVADRYYCNIWLMGEYYDVWDYINNCEVGEFYEIEVDDLLAEIESCK